MTDVSVIAGQQVAQVDHAQTRVGGVAAVWVTADQLRELVERVPRCTGVAAGHVQWQEAFENAPVPGKGGHAAHVVGIVHIRMLGMQADKAIRRGFGRFQFMVLVVGIDQLQLRLLGVTPERVARFQRPQRVDCQAVAVGFQVLLRQCIEFGFAERLVQHGRLVRAGCQQYQYACQQ